MPHLPFLRPLLPLSAPSPLASVFVAFLNSLPFAALLASFLLSALTLSALTPCAWPLSALTSLLASARLSSFLFCFFPITFPFPLFTCLIFLICLFLPFLFLR